MVSRYITIHGHFYQPPRENPWLEYVEVQDSAAPYHDWNQRITDECYLPNASARILDSEGYISQMINNYARISFNFGPTLLSWLEENATEVYKAILEADEESRQRFGGHGSAIAQVYNHIIMPLANPRDQLTQVRWGIKDFQHRYRRPPEGMWLSETAVNIPTLEALAQEGIQFTILSPHQASYVRKIGTKEWKPVDRTSLDVLQPYRVNLPSGRSIAVFFYHEPLARGVAFEGLLRDGAHFARSLMGALDSRTSPQLVSIATDGESFGHHHPFGDMALAFALVYLEREPSVSLTNYGQFLEISPPQWVVRIAENTSWSCAHGIERWRSDCGCQTGGEPGWHQRWRKPLRDALDQLKNRLDLLFESVCRPLLDDPWKARDDYIEVILNPSPQVREEFLRRHALRALSPEERIRVWRALEMERHSLLMFTSCGWFFSDIAGIETIQDLQYAARAAQLGEELGEKGLLEELERRLEEAPGNRPDLPNGGEVFRQMVKPLLVDLPKVAAHWALSELVENSHPHSDEPIILYAYQITPHQVERQQAGKLRLHYGKVEVFSRRTEGRAQFHFCAFHYGDHNLIGKILMENQASQYGPGFLWKPIIDAFQRAEVWDVVRSFDAIGQGNTYTIRHLFKEGQRRIIGQVLEVTMSEAERRLRAIYSDNAPIMRFLQTLNIPVPEIFRSAARFVIQADIEREIGLDHPDPEWIASLKRSAQQWGGMLDERAIGYLLTKKLNDFAQAFLRNPTDLSALTAIERLVACSEHFPSHFNPYQAQVALWQVAHSPLFQDYGGQSSPSHPQANTWLQTLTKLARLLRVKVF